MDMIDLNNFSIQRIVFELRHKTLFNIPGNKYKILDSLTKEYPTYNDDNLELIILSNPIENTHINIGLNKFDFAIKGKFNNEISEIIAKTLKKIKQVTATLDRINKIETATRVGTRIFFTQTFTNKGDIENVIVNNFFSKQFADGITDFDEVFNPSLKFSIRKSNIKAHINVSPQQEQLLKASSGETVLVNSADQLLVDCDIFRDTNMNLKHFDSYTNSIQPMITHISNYLSKLGGNILQ